MFIACPIWEELGVAVCMLSLSICVKGGVEKVLAALSGLVAAFSTLDCNLLPARRADLFALDFTFSNNRVRYPLWQEQKVVERNLCMDARLP